MAMRKQSAHPREKFDSKCSGKKNEFLGVGLWGFDPGHKHSYPAPHFLPLEATSNKRRACFRPLSTLSKNPSGSKSRLREVTLFTAPFLGGSQLDRVLRMPSSCSSCSLGLPASKPRQAPLTAGTLNRKNRTGYRTANMTGTRKARTEAKCTVLKVKLAPLKQRLRAHRAARALEIGEKGRTFRQGGV